VSSSKRIQFLRRQAFQRQGGRCCYCGVRMWLVDPAELGGVPSERAAAKVKCTAEHLHPRALGGADAPHNIAACCAHCNHTRHKRQRPPEPAAYREDVRQRVARGSWHDQWVYGLGLLARRSRGPDGSAST